MGISLCPADLVSNRIGVVGQIDARLVRSIGLRHLLGAVAQRHHARRRTLDQRLGLRKECVSVAARLDRLREVVVEFLRDIAGELQVLLLVLSYRYVRCPINENIGGHQRGIGVEADRGVLAVFARFFLELGHPVEPAQAGHAVEYPGELRMLSDLTLIEDDMFFRIDPAGNEGGGHLACVLRQLLGAAPDRQRLGNRVQVDDAVDALVPVLQRDELGDGAEVISEMQIACRLYAGKHSFLEAHARTSPMAPPDGTSHGAGASPFVYRREMPAGAIWPIAAGPAAHHCFIASSRSAAILRALLHESSHMASTQFDVLGIGNAIVDVIARTDEGFLAQHKMRKGTMQLIDEAQAARLYDAMGPAVVGSCGWGANTNLG